MITLIYLLLGLGTFVLLLLFTSWVETFEHWR